MTNKFKQLLTATVAVVALSCTPVMAAPGAVVIVSSTQAVKQQGVGNKDEASGQPSDNETAAQTRQRHCTSMANMAETIMRNYQSGSSIKAMLQRADETSLEVDASVRDDVLRVFKETIIEAGAHPKYSSPSYRQKAVTDFSDKIMMRCILSKKAPF